MKKINPASPLTLGIIAIVFGLILIYFGKSVLEFSVIATGITLIAIATIQQIALTRSEPDKSKSGWKTLSASLILLLFAGIALVAFNQFWVQFAFIIVGIVILLLAIAYIMQILQAKDSGLKVSAVHYLIFGFIVALSILILTQPSFIADYVIYITGGVYIFCGALQLINYFTFKRMVKLQQEKLEE